MHNTILIISAYVTAILGFGFIGFGLDHTPFLMIGNVFSYGFSVAFGVMFMTYSAGTAACVEIKTMLQKTS